MDKDKVNQLLNDFKSARYCCHRIIELNEELEVLEHKMLGLSHFIPELTKEQEKSSKPMPTFHGGYTSPVAMFAEEDRIESEINYYRRRLNECKPIELLSLRDQNMLFDLYFNFKSSWDVAEKYGYSRQGLWKHIKMNLKQLI